MRWPWSKDEKPKDSRIFRVMKYAYADGSILFCVERKTFFPWNNGAAVWDRKEVFKTMEEAYHYIAARTLVDAEEV